MDKLVKYRQIIKDIIRQYEAWGQPPHTLPDQVEDHAVIDEENSRYILFRTGWWRDERINAAALYVRLYNDKIYIEEDLTEDGIATDLLAAGVPREDIVLAFHPPEMRQYTEFAVA